MKTPVWLPAAAGVVLIVALLVVAWTLDPFGRRKRAETKAAVATQDAEFKGEAVKAADTFHTSTIVIRERAQGGEDAIREAPGADAPLDPGFSATLCAQLAGMRDGSAACVPDHP